MKKINKGFTLIELLVVIGIIAVLTGLIAFNFNSARARARDVQRKNDMKAMEQALELYRNDNGQTFPSSTVPARSWTDIMTLLMPSYITKAFADPKNSITLGSWKDYVYVCAGNPCMSYTLTACLENRSDTDKLMPSTNCGPNNAGVTYQLTTP